MQTMRQNKLLLFIIITFSSQEINSNPIKNFLAKFVLFYASQFTTTTSHELGHALVSHLRGFNPKVKIGVTAGKYRRSDPFILIDPSLDPNVGVTLSARKKTENASTALNRDILGCAMGPIFGIVSKIIQIKLLDVFADKINYDVALSLNNFIIANIIGEFIYGFTP